MTRRVRCQSGEPVPRVLDDIQCSPLARPISRKECKREDCRTMLFMFPDSGENTKYYWRYSLWTPVSFNKCIQYNITVVFTSLSNKKPVTSGLRPTSTLSCLGFVVRPLLGQPLLEKLVEVLVKLFEWLVNCPTSSSLVFFFAFYRIFFFHLFLKVNILLSSLLLLLIL